MNLVNLLADDKNLITYRPKLNRITGSVTATILLQQILFWYKSKNYKPFFKFKEKCEHQAYQEGDSWCEELGFTRREFDTALFKIGQKIKKGDKKENEKLIYYWSDMSRKTYYEVNLKLLEKKLNSLYEVNKINDETEKAESDFTKRRICTLRKGGFVLYEKAESDFIYTENTAENTAENTRERELSFSAPNKNNFEKKVLEELKRNNFKNIDKNSVKSILKYTNSMKQIINVILHIENTNKAKEIKTLVALLRDNDYEKIYKIEEKKKKIDKKKNENAKLFSYENDLETIENKEIREKKEKISTEIMTNFTKDKQERMFLINKLISINNLQEILKFQIELEKLKTS